VTKIEVEQSHQFPKGNQSTTLATFFYWERRITKQGIFTFDLSMFTVKGLQ
jgi:hypothetical protein